MSTHLRVARAIPRFVASSPPLSYDAAVLADTPDLYWIFGDTAGTTSPVDASGNTRTGTAGPGGSVTFGSAGVISGDAETSALFATGNVFRNHETWMDAAAITLEAVIKPTGVSGSQTIVGIDDVGTNLKARVRLSGSQVQAFLSGGAHLIASASGSITAGGIFHIAFTVGAGGEELYVNGSLAASTTGSTLGAVNTTFIVGALTSGFQEPFNGKIGRVAAYTSRLTSTQVAAHAALL